MIFPYFVFVIFLSSVACESTDGYLSVLSIKIDDSCVRDDIGKNKYKNLSNVFTKCVMDISQPYGPNLMNGSIDDQIDTFCRQQESRVTCRPEIMQTLNPCLTGNQRNYLKYYLESKKATAGYSCENQDLVKEFRKAFGSKCANQDPKNLAEKCQTYLVQMMEVNPDNAFTKKICQSREMLAKCIADNSRSCAGEIAYEVTMGSFYAGFNATPCIENVSRSIEVDTLNTALIALVALCCFLFF